MKWLFTNSAIQPKKCPLKMRGFSVLFCFVFGLEYALEGKILNREFIKIYLTNKLKRVKMDSKYPLGIQSSAEDPKINAS